jgi:hypothetical protein
MRKCRKFEGLSIDITHDPPPLFNGWTIPLSSVSDLDPDQHGSTLILVDWIRIQEIASSTTTVLQIQIRVLCNVADPDPH